MIQDYLKTGMSVCDDPTINLHHYPDYDAISRYCPHNLNDCCQKMFCQVTDKYHFPSFQIRVPHDLAFGYLDAWFHPMSDWGTLNDGISAPFTFPMDVYNTVDGCVVSHDYRDRVVYPPGFGGVNYEDCFYLVIEVGNPCGPGYHKYVTQPFRVCDCEPDGVGDGLNLIENGCFEDWSGAADPNNKPDGWTLANNDATNYVADAGGKCQMISDNTQAIYIRQSNLTIGKWYVVTINITAVVAGGVTFVNVGDLITWTTVGVKNFVFQATSATIDLKRFGITNITFTDVRIEEFIGFAFCDMLTLNWWSDCDWDSIIYQYGFRNSLVLDSSLQTPTEDIVINPDERQGEMFVHDVIIKKRYKFNIRIPEYLWNALIRLPAYGSEMPNFHCWITLPDGSACPMSEVAILGEWDVGNCMNTFTIEFVDNDEYPVVATNCCDNEDISEI